VSCVHGTRWPGECSVGEEASGFDIGRHCGDLGSDSVVGGNRSRLDDGIRSFCHEMTPWLPSAKSMAITRNTEFAGRDRDLTTPGALASNHERLDRSKHS
jgi:hypothetical protein